MPGNPWDEHMLAETPEQFSILTGAKPKIVIVDKGYQGVTVDGVRIRHSGQKRGLTQRCRPWSSGAARSSRPLAIEIGRKPGSQSAQRHPGRRAACSTVPCDAGGTTAGGSRRSCGFFAPKSPAMAGLVDRNLVAARHQHPRHRLKQNCSGRTHQPNGNCTSNLSRPSHKAPKLRTKFRNIIYFKKHNCQAQKTTEA
ncbi:hypothetical protein THIX_10309 [Thiomonas sp. X19]|nr:hypothetical protein THIX_10309 [Thiomonas sp. X19]